MILSRMISSLTRLTKWISMTAILFMMLVITSGVVSRILGFPTIGNDELVQILQVILIMCAFAFAQANDRHISIGIITDHLPKRVQTVIDMIGYMITIAFCVIVGSIFWQEALENLQVTKETSLLLRFPLYILKFVTSIGFFIWGLETVNRTILLITGMIQTKSQLERELGA